MPKDVVVVVLRPGEVERMRNRTYAAFPPKKPFLQRVGGRFRIRSHEERKAELMRQLKSQPAASSTSTDLRPELIQNFPCGNCQRQLDLTQWTCGSCDFENNLGRPNSSPFTACMNEQCNHPQQTAILCPFCKAHLVIDREAYERLESYLPPFNGVAVVKGTQGERLADLLEQVDQVSEQLTREKFTDRKLKQFLGTGETRKDPTDPFDDI